MSGDDYAYARILTDRWEANDGWDLGLIEHDVQVPWMMVYNFETCPELWCSAVYPWTTNIGPALGCVRFREQFMRENPDAMRLAAEMPSAYGQAGHWRQVGWYLTDLILRRRGLWPHLHLPPIEHLNPEQALLPEVAHLSVAEHLANLGYTVSEDGLTASHLEAVAA